MDWIAGGSSAYADTLAVASVQGRIVVSQTASSQVAITYLRNPPIDLAFTTGTMYILATPATPAHGRIYKVTGF
jgi:hypothetical protein